MKGTCTSYQCSRCMFGVNSIRDIVALTKTASAKNVGYVIAERTDLAQDVESEFRHEEVHKTCCCEIKDDGFGGGIIGLLSLLQHRSDTLECVRAMLNRPSDAESHWSVSERC